MVSDVEKRIRAAYDSCDLPALIQLVKEGKYEVEDAAPWVLYLANEKNTFPADKMYNMMEYLIRNWCSPMLEMPMSGEKKTLLHCVRNPALVKLYVEYGADVNALDSDGATPLHRAVDAGRSTIVEALCDAHADIKAVWKTVTPLGLARARDNASVVTLLVKASDNRQVPVVVDLRSFDKTGVLPISAGKTYAW